MHPVWALLIGLVIGIALGVVASWVLRRATAVQQIPQLDPHAEPIVVPVEVAALVGVLNAAAIVIGPHDEVRCANRAAVRSSLVRGTRVHNGELLELVREARDGHELRVADLQVPLGRGQATVHYAVRVAPLGEHLLIAIAEDRTAERRLDEVRKDFVANVSHELKTPIGAISLLAEAVQDAADDPEAVQRFGTRMAQESSRLSQMVQQIIELSRLQSIDPLSRADVVDLDSLFAGVVDRIKVDAESRQVTLRVAGERGLEMYGDASQLSTAVGNLVENAVLYSNPGAKVAISAHRVAEGADGEPLEPHERFIEISVSDNGIGIAPEDKQRIFERFYRVDYARSRANGGTGLGLSIVKHAVAAHGGTVEVWSRLGEGSTFTLRFPEHRDEQPAVEEYNGAAGPDRSGPNQEETP